MLKTTSPGLYQGYAGIIFSSQFKKFSDLQQKQWVDLACRASTNLPPELINGSAGVLLALLQTGKKWPTEEKILLKSVLRQISESKVGHYWAIDPEVHLSKLRLRLNDSQIPVSKIKKSIVVDLGLAHGIAGTVFVLSKYCLLRPESRKKIAPQIAGLSKYLLSFYKKAAGKPLPAFSYSHRPSTMAAMDAWCYGLPGVSLSLLWASMALDSEVLKNCSLEMFSKWNLRGNRVAKKLVDPSFCHGIAGLAEISRFFYLVTKDGKAYTSWRFWFLEMQQKKIPVTEGLLTGETGVKMTSFCFEKKDAANTWSAMMGTAR